MLQQVESKFAQLKQTGSSREEFIKLVRSQVGYLYSISAKSIDRINMFLYY